MRSLILAGADKGHCPYLSVLSQPEGLGWKRMPCSGAYLSHLRRIMESTALEISCRLWASCPGNLNCHYVLDSRHNLQQDKWAEAALFAAHTEGLSDERSLAERQFSGYTTAQKYRGGLHVATSTEEALGNLSKTGNKIQVNKPHSAASLVSKQRHVLTQHRKEVTASSVTHSTQGHSDRQDPSLREKKKQQQREAFIHLLRKKPA